MTETRMVVNEEHVIKRSVTPLPADLERPKLTFNASLSLLKEEDGMHLNTSSHDNKIGSGTSEAPSPLNGKQ